MALSTADQQLIQAMKQREFSLKKRQRAANAIFNELRRYRSVVRVSTALIAAVALTVTCVAVNSTFSSWSQLWRQAIVTLLVGAVAGWLLTAGWLHTTFGRRLLARRETALNRKYSGELHAGRRWQQFYYRGEDISAYVGQILYTIESERRFDSVEEALAFAQQHSRVNPAFKDRGLELFVEVAAQTDLVVISSTDGSGRPSSRFMRFVKTDRPGVWYMTTAPDAPKVHEFDRGELALITAPTESGATISSNRIRVRRADRTFGEVAHLYRDQVPRYLEGMSEADQECELVYELRLDSAKVSNWVNQELVVFDHAEQDQ